MISANGMFGCVIRILSIRPRSQCHRAIFTYLPLIASIVRGFAVFAANPSRLKAASTLANSRINREIPRGVAV
jgi:hypothetical protein